MLLMWTIVKVALKSLLSSKLRSTLSMLGVIIGVASVIAMLSLAEGARTDVMQSFAKMGTNTLTVMPSPDGEWKKQWGTVRPLTVEDAAAMAELPEIELVTPVAGESSSVTAAYFEKNDACNLIGVAPAYFTIYNRVVEKGRRFSEADDDNAAAVAVIGPTVASKLFGETNPVDETIRLDGLRFRVIGVLRAKGSRGWGPDLDNQILAPYSTVAKRVFGSRYPWNVNAQVRAGIPMADATRAVKQLLRRRHRLPAEAICDFQIWSPTEMLEEMTKVLAVFQALMGGIGIGMDRLVMFFTNTWSLKEVILFPTLRPENK